MFRAVLGSLSAACRVRVCTQELIALFESAPGIVHCRGMLQTCEIYCQEHAVAVCSVMLKTVFSLAHDQCVQCGSAGASLHVDTV